MRLLLSLVIAALVFTNCAKPPGSFRLTGGAVLIPPGVRDASISTATIRVSPRRRATCRTSPSGLTLAGKTITVSRKALDTATAEELYNWVATLETSGCVTTREAATLATALVDSLPLDLNRRRLLRGENLTIRGALDLNGSYSLRVVSPVFRAGTPRGSVIASTPAAVTASPNGGLNVEMKANPDLTGYEVAWYDVVADAKGPGLKIVPRSAEIHLGKSVEQATGPQNNPFHFPVDTRFFRYFVMTRSSQNDYNIVLLSAPTAAELARRTDAFRRDAAAYLKTSGETVAVMTRDLGVNPYLRVSINGKLTDIPPGSSLRQALEQVSKEEKPEAIAGRMTLRKPYRTGLVPVTWTNPFEILDLPLEGGEQINY